MTTLKDIAAATDLSISTVSRVLNNSASQVGISRATQERVWQAAQAMNYTPNKMARNLKLGRQPKAILFLYSSTPSSPANSALMIHPFFSHMLHGIHLEVARMRGCYLAYMGATPENRRQVGELLDQAVSGVITFGTMEDGIWRELSKRDIPVVSIEPYSGEDAHAIYVDNQLAISQGIQHLYGLGHRRIHFFSLPDTVLGRGPMEERRQAFLREMAALGLSTAGAVCHVRREPDQSEIGAARRAAYEVFTKENRPSAVLTTHDLSAIGVLEGARDAGLRVPEDLSIVGIDDIDWAAHTYPPLTTVHIPKEELGFRAVTMLRKLLKGQECEERVVRIATQLIIRDSTGSI